MQQTRIKKSVKLSNDEMKALKKFRARFHTTIDAAENIGISKDVLAHLLKIGSAHQFTIEKIRKAIGHE